MEKVNNEYRFFTIEELCKSDKARKYGIKNVPNVEQKKCLEDLIINILDPLRALYGYPISVNSGFRSKQLNDHPSIRGSKTSNHLLGQAADLRCDDIDELYEIAIDNFKDFDEIFLETKSDGSKWLHVAYRKGSNRKKIGKIHNGIFTYRNF